ncbi:site-specific integrase [Acidisoma cladoniae]|uniref:site-specific integrase n=1 Tax=Acidisoma cladoniae TaxID=3040935 RepID=UPI00254E18D4|nr:site-specific integrase [Acidisoma sp. PAMC 29798]
MKRSAALSSPSSVSAVLRAEGAETPLTLRAARSLARSQAYQSAADAPATLRAYKADLANFKAWCVERKLDPMPSTAEVVGAYLADAGRGYALSTLRRRVAAIARAHRIAKQPLDTRHPAIRETLRGIARTHGEPPRRSAAITTAEIKRLLRVCSDDMAGTRDQALFLVCFAGALRRSELVGLDVEHINRTDDGLRLLITRSKTDKEGAGAEIGLSRGRAMATCPVTALERWLEQAEIAAGPIFRKVDRWGKVHSSRLDPDAVRQILKKRALEAKITGTIWEPITPHGMRAGFVTTAYKNGVPDEEIMGHTRHRSLTTMRGSKLNRSSPAGKLGL